MGETKIGYPESEAAPDGVLDSITKRYSCQGGDPTNRRLDVLEAHQYYTRSHIATMHEYANRPFLPADGGADYLVHAMVHVQGSNSNLIFTTCLGFQRSATTRIRHAGRFTFCCFISPPVADQRLAVLPRFSLAALSGTAMKHQYPMKDLVCESKRSNRLALTFPFMNKTLRNKLLYLEGLSPSKAFVLLISPLHQ